MEQVASTEQRVEVLSDELLVEISVGQLFPNLLCIKMPDYYFTLGNRWPTEWFLKTFEAGIIDD